jgi:hypothetical protein
VTARAAELRREWQSPALDTGASCADVEALRVCWDASGKPLRVTPRRTPAPSPSSLGFRCSGQGSARRCVDREATASAFLCDPAGCTQAVARVPDDCEWECADSAGVVVCRGGERPAATPPGAADPAFVCGARRGTSAGAGAATAERICVDVSPDFPHGERSGYRCRFDTTSGLSRRCERAPDAHGIGDACDVGHPCVSGLACAAARCVPFAPEPSCWLDRDCDKGACRFGSCREGVP